MRRRRTDMFGVVILLVACALALTMAAQVSAASERPEPKPSAQRGQPQSCMLGSPALRATRAKRCQNVSESVSQVLGIWVVFTR
jgi:hypothetical protein